MRLHPVKQSDIAYLTNEQLSQINTAPTNRMIPISEKFMPVWNCEDQIILQYGSYGSGKSFFNADDLINKCINNNYFRCYYGRKIFNSIRGSVFITIVEQIEKHNLKHEFSYSLAPTSNMIIKHIKTGNQFIPFGADNPDTLKSIKEPTHFYMEELDQFKPEDFALVYSRIGRTNKSYTQLIGAFNTEKIYDEHWIKKTFFSGDSVPATKVFSTYKDNEFLDKEKYEATLRVSAMGNQQRFDAIANGAWGVMANTDPWFFAFDSKRHISRVELLFDIKQPLYVSFDFNINPATCTTSQFNPGAYVHILKSYKIPNCTLKDLCMRIKSDYPGAIFRVTGDPSGNARSTGYNAANETMYTIIQRELGIGYLQVDKPMLKFTGDDSWRELRIFNNAILQNHPNYYICPIGCKELLKDIQLAKCEDGKDKIYKTSGDSEYGMHLVDGYIYLHATYFNNYLKRKI